MAYYKKAALAKRITLTNPCLRPSRQPCAPRARSEEGVA
jgi:hypothetical protein